MSDSASHHDFSDLPYIDDPGVRHAMRALQQQVTETLLHQQTEIDAMLELMLEKHVTSLSEFKLHLTRLQQDTARSTRLHGAMTVPPQPGPNLPH
ncbi:MAG TPA: hypothetical protein VHP11_11025 [Tepidisphaeraceae bacterium]|nr:hypothetical protein [Tepidisphaeraceae bacterium]